MKRLLICVGTSIVVSLFCAPRAGAQSNGTVQFYNSPGDAFEHNGVAHFYVITSHVPMTVQFETIDGTAKAGERYTATSGTITFTADDLYPHIKGFDVLLNDDNVNQARETFYVRLFNPTNGVVFYPNGGPELVTTVTILDDDLPVVAWDPANYTASEGSTATVTLRRSFPSSQPTSVNYYVQDANHNNVGGNQIATFGANETTKDVSINIPDDMVPNGSRDWHVYIAAVQNGVIGSPGAATITVIDDDIVPTLSVENASAIEGNSGTTTATFRVNLSPAVPFAVDVSVAAEPGTAQNGTDFTFTPATLTFPAGTTELTVPVTILGDTEPETDETFSLVVTGLRTGMGSMRAIGTIINDDAVPVPHITSVTPPTGSTTGNTTVTIAGENFRDSCAVTFGGAIGRLTAPATSTTLTVATPPHAVGSVDVIVNCGGQTDTAPHAFTFATPIPPRSRGVRH